MALVDTLVIFIVGLLVGALGIYIGARVVTDTHDYGYAIVTALIAMIIWALLSWIPLLGWILALIAYIAVINYRYPGGWLTAVGIAFVAWIATLVVALVLALFDITSFNAIGVPGV